MHEGNPVLNIQIGGNGTSTARLYIFVECASFLQSLFQQNKTKVSFREIARLIARNSYLGNVSIWFKSSLEVCRQRCRVIYLGGNDTLLAFGK